MGKWIWNSRWHSTTPLLDSWSWTSLCLGRCCLIRFASTMWSQERYQALWLERNSVSALHRGYFTNILKGFRRRFVFSARFVEHLNEMNVGFSWKWRGGRPLKLERCEVVLPDLASISQDLQQVLSRKAFPLFFLLCFFFFCLALICFKLLCIAFLFSFLLCRDECKR